MSIEISNVQRFGIVIYQEAWDNWKWIGGRDRFKREPRILAAASASKD